MFRPAPLFWLPSHPNSYTFESEIYDQCCPYAQQRQTGTAAKNRNIRSLLLVYTAEADRNNSEEQANVDTTDESCDSYNTGADLLYDRCVVGA